MAHSCHYQRADEVAYAYLVSVHAKVSVSYKVLPKNGTEFKNTLHQDCSIARQKHVHSSP